MSDIVRVLRIVEYIGRRNWVEMTVAQSIHGTKKFEGSGEIRAVTLGTYPEILEEDDKKESKSD